MTQYDVKRLALVLALQAEIEGMKAFNKNRELNGMCVGYNEQQFNYMASQLRELASKHDEEL